MSVFSKVKAKVKDWLTGSSSKSTKSFSKTTTTQKRANTVSNYGGGGSRSLRSESNGGYTSKAPIETKEQRMKREAEERKRKQEEVTKKLAKIADKKSAGKVTKSLSGVERATKKLEEKVKATPPDPKEAARQKSQQKTTEALKKISDNKAYSKATGGKYDIGKNGDEARRRMKSGEYQSDPNAEKYDIKMHPKRESFLRGAESGVTFGASELLAQKSKNRQKTGTEEFYQKNKHRDYEVAGEIAGSLAGFGLTGEASAKALGKVGGKALGEKATAKLATNSRVLRAAEKELQLAIDKGAVNVTSKAMRDQLIKEFAKNRASRIVGAVGEDAAINLTTGAASDINHAILDSDNPEEFAKNMLKSAGANILLGGATSFAPALRTQQGVINRRLRDETVDTIGRMSDAYRGLDDIAGRTTGRSVGNPLAPLKMGEDLDERIARRSLQTAEENARDAEHVAMRRGFIDRANAADEALNRGFTLPNDTLRTSAIDPTLNQVDINQLARNTDVIQRARRQAILDNLLQTAEKNTAISPNRGGFDFMPDIEQMAADNATRIRRAEIDAELDQLQREIRLKRNTASDEELEALNDRFDELMRVRNGISEDADEMVQEATEVNPLEEYWQKNRPAEEPAPAPAPESVEPPKVEAEAPAKPQPPKSKGKSKKKTMTPEEYSRTTDTADTKADNIRKALSGEQTPPAPKTAANTEAPKTAPSASETNASKDLSERVGKTREKKTLKENVDEFAESVRMKVSDSLTAFEDEARKKAKTDHEGMLKDYGAIDKTRRSKAIAGRSIEEHQLQQNGKRYSGTVKRVGADGVEYEIENGKSLKAIYEGMDKATENEFDQFLIMRHAPARLDAGKPIFNGKWMDAKVCEEEAQRLLEKHPEFAKKAEELYQYIQNELRNRVDEGLLPKDIAEEWMQKYPNYVPTGRVGDFSGEHDIWDLASQLKNTSNTTGASEIKAATGSDLDVRSIKEQLSEATSRNWRDMSLNNLFRRMFGDKMGDVLASDVDGGIERVLDNTINLSKSGTKEGGKYFAEIYDNGEMKRVEIEKRFYDAIEDLYKNGRLGNGFDVATDVISKVATPYKNLITSWSPIFMVKNFLRDFPEAIINTRQTKEFMQNMGSAWGEIFNDGEFYQALKDSGVSQANFVNLEEALTKGDKNIFKKGADKLAWLNDVTETYPRLVEFMATIKKAGYDKLSDIPADKYRELVDMAAANAADVTVNFGRSGSVGKMLNRGFVPFFNPSVQGWSKFVRNISEQEGMKPLLGMILKASALGATPTVINNLIQQDNPNWQNISARDKATNYIIAIPPFDKDTNLFIKIPRSRFAAVYGLPAVNLKNDNKMGWAEMIKVSNDQVAPVNPLDSHILSVMAAMKNNKTWYGSPIVPKSLEDLPKSEQYDVNTSNISKALGKATENLPKELQISPKKADYFLDSTFGVAADFALPMTTPSRQGSGSALNKYVTTPAGNVIKRQFTIDSTTQNDLSTRFYDKLQTANTANQSAKGGKAESDEYKRLSAYSTEISDLNKAIQNLQGGDSENKQENIRGLQEVRNKLMQDAIDGKPVPSSVRTMDAVQKYVGTTYAIDTFGSTADKEAVKVYGKSKYGKLSDEEMQKKIDSDKDFYKGVQSIGKLEDEMKTADIESNTGLTKAIALASVDADEDLFGAYGCTSQSRTESANKMDRAKTYLSDGGSTDEYVQLEKVRKTVGKLDDDERTAEIEKLDEQLAKGEIDEADYKKKKDEINYNANISYVGLATSLAEANAPARGYALYDIKDKNIQKGINLAAMGFTARDYREMSKELDADGNGYPKRQEVIDYVANSDVEDKATLFDCLYHYKGRNPFGKPKNYSRAQAALSGKTRGVEQISNEKGDIKLSPEESKSSGYGYRRGYRRWHSYGGGGGSSAKATVPKPKTIKASKLKKGEALVSKRSSSSAKAALPTLKRVEAKIDLPTAKPRKKS